MGELDTAVRGVTLRLGKATPSGLDEKNADLDRLQPLVDFLKLPSPTSRAERTGWIATSFSRDSEWVARARAWWAAAERDGSAGRTSRLFRNAEFVDGQEAERRGLEVGVLAYASGLYAWKWSAAFATSLSSSSYADQRSPADLIGAEERRCREPLN